MVPPVILGRGVGETENKRKEIRGLSSEYADQRIKAELLSKINRQANWLLNSRVWKAIFEKRTKTFGHPVR